MLDLQKLIKDKKPEEVAKLVVDVLEWIAGIVMPAGASTASAVLMAIKVVLGSLFEYQKGTVTAEAVKADMAKLLSALRSTDAKIDDQLKKLEGKG